MMRHAIHFVIRLLFRIVLFCLALVLLFAAGTYVYAVYLNPLPPRVLAAAADRAKTFHIHELSYNQIPAGFREAIIATEDRRFSWDPGIDPVGIARSIYVDIRDGALVQGGSTITQQLVDNTILNQNRTVTRKVLQVINAVGVYDTMSKKQVFTLYANMIYFGNGAYGLFNAAQTYFGLSPSRLNEGELALLAGLPNAPSAYDPFTFLHLARSRERIVLINMVSDGILTQARADKIYALPIHLR